MENIIAYVKKYGALSFDEMPFSEVDSLILSQLSYMNIGKHETESDRFLAKISDLPFIDDFILIKDVWAPEQNLELLRQAAKSKRFGNIKIGFFTSRLDEKNEKQFAAVTYKLAEGIYYIAFRGTDAKLVGWKEDFNLAYLKNVPSQTEAAKYFRRVYKTAKGRYILGGHSKGGNLAIFAAIKAKSRAKKRLLAVYDHDGPGFSEAVYKEKSLKKLYPIIHKTIPQTAIVGLLLAGDIPFTVVESHAHLFMQHDPFSWKISGNSFKKCEGTDMLSQVVSKRIDSWLKKTDNQKRRLFIDSLYSAVLSTGAKTYFDLFKNKKSSAKKFLQAINDTDPEVKELIREMTQELFKKPARKKAKLLR